MMNDCLRNNPLTISDAEKQCEFRVDTPVHFDVAYVGWDLSS